MKKNRAKKDILYIAISSFVFVAIWVGSNIYHALVTSTIQPDIQAQLQPISPKFDTDTIQQLKTRKIVAPVSEVSTASQSAAPTPTESLSPSQNASSSTVENQPNTIERLGQ